MIFHIWLFLTNQFQIIVYFYANINSMDELNVQAQKWLRNDLLSPESWYLR